MGMESELRAAVNNTCITLLKAEPMIVGELYKVIIRAFERALLTVAYQFCRGHLDQLSDILGITKTKTKSIIKREKIKWLGTYPDTHWMTLYSTIYPQKSCGLAEKKDCIIDKFERDIMTIIFFYLIEINKRDYEYLYDFIREDIDIALIKIAYALSNGTSRQAHKFLGISCNNLRSKVRKLGIKTK